MVGESLDGLRTTVLPVTMAAAVMPAMMANGKFHGGITAPTPERNVNQLVALAGILDRRCGSSKAQGFARIELEEIDGLGHIGVGFRPVLADFISEPCAELELTGANDLRCV